MTPKGVEAYRVTLSTLFALLASNKEEGVQPEFIYALLENDDIGDLPMGKTILCKINRDSDEWLLRRVSYSEYNNYPYVEDVSIYL